MACNNCKQKNQNVGSIPSDNPIDGVEPIMTNIMSEQDIGGGILMKLVIFLILVISLPIIILVLVYQVFLNFFLPKSVHKINHKVKSFFRKMIDKHVVIVQEHEKKKKQNQFSENRGYDEESELVDIEVYEDLSDNKKDK